MERQDIERLRQLPIEGVAERLGLVVKKHKALCPFHRDSHPSLSFRVSTNTFRCFVCGAHGGVIDLAMKVLNKSFIDTCKWLADAHNLLLTEWKPAEKTQHTVKFDADKYGRIFEHPFLNDAARHFLFDERHIDERVARWCHLNSWRSADGTPWLQIPYFDSKGRITGVQSRNLSAHPNPRFRFPYGSECHIYNVQILNLLKPGEPLFITEGCSDCWSMLSAGHKAIAIPSATLLKKKDLEQLRSYSRQQPLNLHIYPDADIPGEKLYLQLVSATNDLGACLTRHRLPAGCKDFSDYYLTKYSTL